MSNARGHYGSGMPTYLGNEAPTQPNKQLPWWGNIPIAALGISFVAALGYNVYSLAKMDRDFAKDAAREKRIRDAWSPSKREQYRDSGLTMEAFDDWNKTGRGMSVDEWIRATPEKG